MAFDNTLMARATTSFSDGKTAVYWTYGPSADSIATITASAYFDDWTNQINKDDYLYLVGSDGQDIRAFTSVQGVVPVTVAAFITAGDLADNSVTTAKIAALAVTDAKLAANAVTTVKIAAGAVTEPKVSPNSLTGLVAANVGVADVIGGIPVIFRVDTIGGASANVDVLMTHKVLVTDVWVHVNGLGTTSDTVAVQNITAAITNAMDIDVADTTLVRAGTLDDSENVIAAATNLRIAQVDGGGSDSPPLTVYVLAIRVV